jgi:hypothetical protein
MGGGGNDDDYDDDDICTNVDGCLLLVSSQNPDLYVSL